VGSRLSSGQLCTPSGFCPAPPMPSELRNLFWAHSPRFVVRSPEPDGFSGSLRIAARNAGDIFCRPLRKFLHPPQGQVTLLLVGNICALSLKMKFRRSGPPTFFSRKGPWTTRRVRNFEGTSRVTLFRKGTTGPDQIPF